MSNQIVQTATTSSSLDPQTAPTAETSPAQPTQTQTSTTDEPAAGSETLVLRLRRSEARMKRLKKIAEGRLYVEWDESVVDNEHLNRKASKKCCIFHKQLEFGESEDESDWEAVHLGRPRKGKHAHQHQHNHDDGTTCEHPEGHTHDAPNPDGEGPHCHSDDSDNSDDGVTRAPSDPSSHAPAQQRPPSKGVFPRGVSFAGDDESDDGDDDDDRDEEGGNEDDGIPTGLN